MKVDVAIIGGGPGGSTCAGLLKKYAPDLEVALFEREVFPREHVGESQLPPISKILNEKTDTPIGYINISIIGEETEKLLKQNLEDIKKSKAKGIILDLRGNGG